MSRFTDVGVPLCAQPWTNGPQVSPWELSLLRNIPLWVKEQQLATPWTSTADPGWRGEGQQDTECGQAPPGFSQQHTHVCALGDTIPDRLVRAWRLLA